MLTVLCPIVVYARGSRHEFSLALSDTYAWEGFLRSHGYVSMSKGLCFSVGSDATVPMQCHARSCIVECPMRKSTCTLSDTDARVGCCVHQARDILRADYRGLHGSSVAACSTDHQPQYRLYYAASCTDCGCRIGVRDPHVQVPSRTEQHPLRRGRVLLQRPRARARSLMCEHGLRRWRKGARGGGHVRVHEPLERI